MVTDLTFGQSSGFGTCAGKNALDASRQNVSPHRGFQDHFCPRLTPVPRASFVFFSRTSAPAASAVMAVKNDFRGVARALSLVWAAGCFGAFVGWVLEPAFWRLLELAKVDWHPTYTAPDLYRVLATGGLCGLIFLLTLPTKYRITSGAGNWHFWLRAFAYGLIPALLDIFIVLPHDGHGIGGVDYGAATPVFVILFNTLLWSLPAYFWLYVIGPEDTAQGFGYESLESA